MHSLARLIASIFAFPFWTQYFAARLFLSEREALQGPAQLLATVGGKFGDYTRAAFYSKTLKNCSKNCSISFGVLISDPQTEIGENVYIGPYSIIGLASVGDNAVVASRVSIISGFEQHGITSTDIPIREQSGEFKKVSIGEDVWLGEGAIVGANVGSKSVIGAGSVVTQEIEEMKIAVGNPAKIIRDR